MLGWFEIVLIIATVLVLFGGSRLPDLARSIGKALKSYKFALRGDDGVKARKVKGEKESGSD